MAAWLAAVACSPLTTTARRAVRTPSHQRRRNGGGTQHALDVADDRAHRGYRPVLDGGKVVGEPAYRRQQQRVVGQVTPSAARRVGRQPGVYQPWIRRGRRHGTSPVTVDLSRPQVGEQHVRGGGEASQLAGARAVEQGQHLSPVPAQPAGIAFGSWLVVASPDDVGPKVS